MNRIILSGEFTPFEFSHESHGERIMKSTLLSYRYSGTIDYIPILIPERYIKDGKYINIEGTVRSYVHEEKNQVMVYGSNVDFSDEPSALENIVEISGTVIKEPRMFKTHRGFNLTNLLLLVNRDSNQKSDKIPCVIWGEDAVCANVFEIGTEIHIVGRLQSRSFIKKQEDEYIEKMTIEVSAKQMEVIDGDKN